MRYPLLVACCFLTIAVGADRAAALAGSPLAGIDGSILVAQSGNCPPAPGGTGLLTDGDFSGAPWPGILKTYSAGQEFAPDWRVTEATIDLNGTYFQTPNGLCSVDLDGTPGYGAVRHKHIPTTVGQAYTVSFLFSGNGGGPPFVKHMRIRADFQYRNYSWDVRHSHDAQHGQWQQESWIFTARGPGTWLTFDSLDESGGQDGCVVADVVLTANSNVRTRLRRP
jgi:uncharacterized protein DUF642